ncbi:MAG: DegT/DnrJ/EryC1/StrS family aminotransferase [Lentisphaeria bacterium]|nr:DegT/DnrJ/EryC1/StrS family aminotransferase [Lentisphaeria bacterium]
MIPQCNPLLSYLKEKAGLDRAVQSVLEGGWYILGKEVQRFEKDFAAETGARYCVSCGNGTDAIELALRSMGIGQGDKVVTVANTAVATVAGIERTGATACFADVDDTFTMAPDSLRAVLRAVSGVKAVVVVHLFGTPADMTAISKIADEYGIPIVEDCAQAHGAKYGECTCGTIGQCGCFSFYPTKNLGAFGDGGAIITSSEERYHKLLSLRQYGWERKFISECSGLNSRLDEIQAAILSVKLPGLKAMNQQRAAIASRYTEGFSNICEIITPCIPDNVTPVYHQYVIRCKQRDRLQQYLKEKGIGTAIHYPVAIHLQPAYVSRPLAVSLPVTEQLNKEILSLPMYPELTGNEVSYIIQTVRGFFR